MLISSSGSKASSWADIAAPSLPAGIPSLEQILAFPSLEEAEKARRQALVVVCCLTHVMLPLPCPSTTSRCPVVLPGHAGSPDSPFRDDVFTQACCLLLLNICSAPCSALTLH